MRSLRDLARELDLHLDDGVEVSGIAHDSRRVRAGELFVALPGSREDGAAYVRDAVARGAVAACVERRAVAGVGSPGVPLLVVHDAHAALAQLSAAFHDHPARELELVGVTGTLGKTSTALLVQTALAASGESVGVVGSLGVRVRGPAAARIDPAALPGLDGMTTPDAPTLHRAFRTLADAGVRRVVMEVTSHALDQRRVDGLTLALGVVTNLVPDEHLDYHGTPERYLRTKSRFFDLLAPGAPVVLNADDPRVLRMANAAARHTPRPSVTVSLGSRPSAHGAPDPDVVVEGLRTDAAGSSFSLRVRHPLSRLAAAGGKVAPRAIPVVLPVPGVQQVMNAALAATAALVAGADPARLTEALAEMEPMRRRMEVVRAAAPVVIDDTAGNPDTLDAVFASVDGMPRRVLHVIFGVRGSRGDGINRRLGRALARHARAQGRRAPVHLLVTSCDDVADARNRVRPSELEAVLAALGAARVPHAVEPRLGEAVARLAPEVRPDDVVLLLGAQGMDRASELFSAAFARTPVVHA